MSSAKAVVVHRGARDRYEVAAALARAGLLEKLVTDLYWPPERPAPGALARVLKKRSHSAVPGTLVRQTPVVGLASFLTEKLSFLPFSMRRAAVRFTDAHLGRTAGLLARRRNALLVSYSYYGYDAFEAYGGPGILFQLHPHPRSVRRILEKERRDHPECAKSLEEEWELSLPARDFERLVAETELARGFLVASSFTRETLIENGAAAESIRVVPYGVDLDLFRPTPDRQAGSGALKLLFVGTVNQRKGISYLLEALRLVGEAAVELTICGRIAEDRALFRDFGDRIRLRGAVSFAELQEAYRAADLFVLPSVAEGFGHVLLEALASGLPILSTTHTAAPDLIEDGAQGFVVEPRRADLIAWRIEWCLSHRAKLLQMRDAAREQAEQFSWRRFEDGVVEAIQAFVAGDALPRVM